MAALSKLEEPSGRPSHWGACTDSTVASTDAPASGRRASTAELPREVRVAREEVRPRGE